MSDCLPSCCTAGRFPTNVAPKAGPPHVFANIIEQSRLPDGNIYLKLRLDSLDALDFWMELDVIVPSQVCN